MTKLRKLAALLLAAAMVFAITACGKTVTYESYYSYEDDTTVVDKEASDTASETASETASQTASNTASQTASKNQTASNAHTGTNTIVAPGVNQDAKSWGIKESSKGIDDTVDLKGKTLRMLCWGGSNYTSAKFQRTVKAFEKKYGCTVKIDRAAFGTDYVNAVRNSIAAKKPYDIVFMHASWSYDSIAANLYNPLNDTLTTADLLNSNNKGIDLNKSAEISWNGKIYGVCGYDAVNPMLIYYNKVMFDEAGLEDPRTLYNQGKWTWDKFFELGTKVTDASNDKWFGEFNFFRTEICATFGGSPITIINGVPTVTIDSNKYIAGMKNISKLGSGATKIIRTQTPEDQLQNFLDGKFYVYTEESDRYITIMEKIDTCNAFRRSGANLGVVPYPLGDTNTEGLYPTGWIECACSPLGSNPQYAVAWMQFKSTYNDPVKTDKTQFNTADQKMIDKLLAKILPRRCSYSGGGDLSASALEWNLVTEAARGNDLTYYINMYKPLFQANIDATLKQLKNVK